MKMSYGRKFWVAVILSIELTAIYFTTLIIQKSIAVSITLMCFGLLVTVGFMFIGGNVWNAWIKSKYFHSELKDPGGES